MRCRNVFVTVPAIHGWLAGKQDGAPSGFTFLFLCDRGVVPARGSRNEIANELPDLSEVGSNFPLLSFASLLDLYSYVCHFCSPPSGPWTRWSCAFEIGSPRMRMNCRDHVEHMAEPRPPVPSLALHALHPHPVHPPPLPLHSSPMPICAYSMPCILHIRPY